MFFCVNVMYDKTLELFSLYFNPANLIIFLSEQQPNPLNYFDKLKRMHSEGITGN